MLTEHNNYVDFLKKDFRFRKSRRRLYSMRAYARDLGLTPAHLSNILNNKAKLTEKMGERVADKLKFPLELKNYFLLLTKKELAKTKIEFESIENQITTIQFLKARIAASVEKGAGTFDWYTLAILELSSLQNFNFTPDEIARSLSISLPETHSALEWLKENKFLLLGPDGRLRRSEAGFLEMAPSAHNKNFKKVYEGLMKKAVEALYEQPPEQRFSGCEVLQFSQDDMAAANQIIEDCLTKILALANSRKAKHDGVYSLNLHFHKVSK